MFERGVCLCMVLCWLQRCPQHMVFVQPAVDVPPLNLLQLLALRPAGLAAKFRLPAHGACEAVAHLGAGVRVRCWSTAHPWVESQPGVLDSLAASTQTRGSAWTDPFPGVAGAHALSLPLLLLPHRVQPFPARWFSVLCVRVPVDNKRLPPAERPE